MKEMIDGDENWVERIERRFSPKEPLSTLPLTLIIPTYNCSALMVTTLESIQHQNYPHLELIIIDANSTDRTLEIVNSYPSLMPHISHIAEYNLPNMMNYGISLASHSYITFLYPGSFYISAHALFLMAEAAYTHSSEIIYSGTIQKEIKRPAKLIQEFLSPSLLAQGRIPATIVATWFRADLFDRIGPFDGRYQERALFELFCRLSSRGPFVAQLVDRVLVDFDYGPFSYAKQLRLLTQTWSIISHYFGFGTAVKWFIKTPNRIILRALLQYFRK